MAECVTDRRENDGITVGLIDTLITVCRILARRDLHNEAVQEALKDLQTDADVMHVLGAR